MAKSYNPFKMWLPYVMAIIFFLFGGFYNPFFQPIICPTNVSWIVACGLSGGNSFAVIFADLIVPIIFGFLLGWGIHSIIRAVRK